MKRRNFLGFLGGAAVGGPSVAQSTLSSAGFADLAPAGIRLNQGIDHMSVVGAQSTTNAYDNIGWAKKRLDELYGLTAAAREHQKRNHYISQLDPDTASLRSVSLTSKIKIAKDRSFEIEQRRSATHLQGIIAKLWE